MPVVTSVTALPATVQIGVVSDENATGKPDEAVAEIATGDAVSDWAESALNDIVCAMNAVTVKLCATDVAAFHFASPACDAVIVHVPEPLAVSVTVLPLTEHAVEVVENPTASPEDAAALTVNGGAVFGSGDARLPNVIDWLPLMMVVVELTLVAAVQLPSPACDARIVQLPSSSVVIVEPLVVQNVGVVDAYESAKPDDAVPGNAIGALLNAVCGGRTKPVMLCAACVMVTVRVGLTVAGA